MITRDKLSELFVEGLPSLRLDRPALSADLSEWRSCFAEHYVQIKKSGPASEAHIATLLLERLFVDGDEDVRQEAHRLAEAVIEEGRKANLDTAALSRGFGLQTRQALEVPVEKVELAAPTAAASPLTFWKLVGIVFGFISWAPICVLRLLGVDNDYLTGAGWMLAGLGLGFGLLYGYRKKV